MSARDEKDYASFPQTQDVVDLNFHNTSHEKIKEAYKNEANLHDKLLAEGGFVGHIHVADALFHHAPKFFPNVPKEQIRLIDAGAGTGKVATHLKEHGYTNIDAMDISQDMLNVAKEKKLYQKLICLPVEKAGEQIGNGQYDVLLSSGLITPGQLQASHLIDLIRLAKIGGLFCVNVRMDAMDTEVYGYEAKFEELESQGVLETISREVKDYFTCANAEQFSHSKCYVLVCKILKHTVA